MRALGRVTLPDPKATAALAERIGAVVGAGDVLLLSGGLGSGKTHFARALIQSRQAKVGAAEEVPSPSFTLVQTYQAGELEIWHADLYRLGGPDEALELGLDEAFQTALCLIEWPDVLAGHWPEGAVRLTFAMDAEREGVREIALYAEPGADLANRLLPLMAAA